MGFSTSCPEPALRVIIRCKSSRLSETGTKPMINLISKDTQNFAYYVSLNGNRSNYGLQPPIRQVVHDAENGYGAFASLIFNSTPSNQPRLAFSLRQDYYQIAIDPDLNSSGNQVYPSHAFATVSANPMATWPSRGSTHSIQTCWLQSPLSIIIIRPVISAVRTMYR
jgi:hypothetical protein